MTDPSTEAERFASNMVRVGTPDRLRNLVIAVAGAAEGRRYVVDVTTTEGKRKCERSRIEHDFDFDGQPIGGRIFVCAHAGQNATWDLLHELGHALVGRDPAKDKTCEHETAMWELGWQWAKTTSGHGGALSQDDKAAFEARAVECLKSYCGPSAATSI